MKAVINGSVTTDVLEVSDASGFRSGDVLRLAAYPSSGHLIVVGVDPGRPALLLGCSAHTGIPVICSGLTIEVDWFEMARRELSRATERLYEARARELEAERTGRKA